MRRSFDEYHHHVQARRELRSPLDALLVDAALGTLRRFVPDASAARLAVSLVRRPLTTGRRLRGLASEFARIAAGTSELAPAKRDRRFTDPAWMTNPVLRRAVQAYLAAGQAAGQLVADAALESRDERRIRFGVDNLVEALSPSNVPLVNPLSAKAVVDTGGLNIARGGLSFLRDLASPPRIPEMVDRSAFEVGRNIAVTPGAVVLRTEVLELIQYARRPSRSNEVPLLIVPPTINKFYALDLAPGRSLSSICRPRRPAGVRAFRGGIRTPGTPAGGLDTYVQAVLDALDAVERVYGSGRTALMGVCSGGILASIAAAYLAAIGRQDRLAALRPRSSPCSTPPTPAPWAPWSTGAWRRRAKAMSRRRGYLDGRALAEVFAWLRPGDLIWNYWVNNYLLGKKPPAFDILFWNADTTRMTAALHADFVDLAMDNKLVTPGALTVLGAPIDLAQDRRRRLHRGRHRGPHHARGRTATAARSCLAARPGSSCPPAATSPRSSTRRATPRPPTTPTTS